MIEYFCISIVRIIQDYKLAMATMIFDTQFDYIIVRRAQYHWRYMGKAMIVVELIECKLIECKLVPRLTIKIITDIDLILINSESKNN
jgi:hypothetical protein